MSSWARLLMWSGRLPGGLLSGALALLFVINWVPCVLVEDFEGSWPAQGWTPHEAGGRVESIAAHDGGQGVMDVPWHYRTDVSVRPGTRLSAWTKATNDRSGRLYLGFDATSAGAKSFVIGFNTDDFRFHRNPRYDFEELTNTSQQLQSDHWYRVEIEIEHGGNVVGRIYDSDGTTLVNSARQSYGSVGTGGIALRTFGGVAVDTITLCP